MTAHSTDHPAGTPWRKSSYSSPAGNCVEVRATAGGDIEVRDSKNRDAPSLTFTSTNWNAFVSHAKEREFDV